MGWLNRRKIIIQKLAQLLCIRSAYNIYKSDFAFTSHLLTLSIEEGRGGVNKWHESGDRWGYYSAPSTWGSGKDGIRFRRRAAFPFTRRTDSLWNRWAIASPSSLPNCLACADPIFLIWRRASSCHPPRDSTGRGRNTIPSLLQSAPCVVIFRSNA